MPQFVQKSRLEESKKIMGENFPQNKLNLADSEDEKEEELAQSIDMF